MMQGSVQGRHHAPQTMLCHVCHVCHEGRAQCARQPCPRPLRSCAALGALHALPRRRLCRARRLQLRKGAHLVVAAGHAVHVDLEGLGQTVAAADREEEVGGVVVGRGGAQHAVEHVGEQVVRALVDLCECLARGGLPIRGLVGLLGGKGGGGAEVREGVHASGWVQ